MSATGYLALRMLLTETAVLRKNFTPLHVESEPVIPGRVQRGMLAAALQRSGRDDVDDLIRRWVAEGEEVRFAPALPCGQSRSGHGEIAVPSPATLHSYPVEGEGEGEAERLVDLLRVRKELAAQAEPVAPEIGKRRRGFVLPDLRTPVTVAMHTEQYLGTGRAGEPLQGVPFLTIMLDAGQVFEARWRLWAETEEALLRLAADIMEVLEKASGRLVLGTGSTRAHGGRPEILPVDGGPLVHDRIHRPKEQDWPTGETRDLVLLAPALMADDYGEPRPGRLPQAVTALCADVLGDDAAECVDAVVESEVVEGYHRMYRSAMASRWGAAAGSVVRLKAQQGITAAQVRELESRAVGQRQVDGHGCFVLLKPASAVDRESLRPEKPIRPVATLRLPDGTACPERGSPADPPDSGGEVGRLRDRMLTAAVVEPLRAHARDLAGQAENPPSPSLLGRLRAVEAQPRSGEGSASDHEVLQDLAMVARGDGNTPPGTTPRGHKLFTGKAKTDAEQCTLPSSNGAEKRNLTGWLHGAVAGAAPGAREQDPWWTAFAPERELVKAIADVDLDRAAGTDRLSEPAQQWLKANRPWMIRLMVGTWLAEAAQRGRLEADRKEQQ